ncbi:MAG: hypothetical protein SOH81_03675 [Acetobacter sp.]
MAKTLPHNRFLSAIFFSTAAPITIIIMSLTACSPASGLLRTDLKLARAGFTAHPANTTARYELMNLLPEGELTYRDSDQGPIYLFADKLGCSCVYMGDQAAWNAWNIAQKNKTPSEQPTEAMIAENRQHPGWEWSAWDKSADPGPSRPRYNIETAW